MMNGLNHYKQSNHSSCGERKRMLALALKVYTQRMFIISEADLNAKNVFGAWDTTILVCSVENTICEPTREGDGINIIKVYKYFRRGKGSYTWRDGL